MIFTFILAYKGGTYVKQVAGGNLQDAIDKWQERVKQDKWAEEQLKDISVMEAMADDRPVLLKGMCNTWCVCSQFGESQALLNIVRTAGAETPVLSDAEEVDSR